jgi:putative membrane protein
MLIAGLALFGPLDTLAERSAAWHMVQHMLLIVVVAPLAVLARPLPQWRALLGAPADALWRPAPAQPPPDALRAAARRGHLVLACARTLHRRCPDPAWHVLEHACFLFTGWLFWWSVLRPGRAGVLSRRRWRCCSP